MDPLGRSERTVQKFDFERPVSSQRCQMRFPATIQIKENVVSRLDSTRYDDSKMATEDRILVGP